MQKAPVLQREIGASACLNSRFDLVADPYLADTRYPAPAARCDHHDAAAEAASPVTVTMAVAVITHSTTTPTATTTGGSCGRNERGGANSGDGSDGEDQCRMKAPSEKSSRSDSSPLASSAGQPTAIWYL